MQKLILSILLSAGFLFVPVTASADPPCGMMGGMGGAGMGMMGGMGGFGAGPMMGSRGCGCFMDGHGMTGLDHFSMLNLNPDQRAKLNRIRLDLRKQEWALKGKTFDFQSNLYDLYQADRPDPRKIGAVYGHLFDIRRQMIEARIEAMNRARDILNKDQLDKLKQLQQQRETGPCSMHQQMHGMMDQ